MSVWTEVKGGLWIPITSHFSVKKSIDTTFESANAKCLYIDDSTTDLRVTKVEFSFVESGVDAAEQIQEWVDKLPKGSKVDLTASVRFLR